MKTCLHFYTESSENSIFYQILKKDIDLKENETFNYNEDNFNALDSQNQISFDQKGLKKGNYIVIATKTEQNEYWGEIRLLFIRPT